MTEATVTETGDNRPETLPQVITAVKQLPEIAPYARIVGRWVWCEFPSKPSEEIRSQLKRMGFHWSKTRQAWQHHCGFRTRHSSGDPRFKYGEVPVSALED